MTSSRLPADEPWLDRIDAHVAIRLLGPRAFNLALGNAATYDEGPTLGPDGHVRAALVDSAAYGRTEGLISRVAVWMRNDDAVAGECSRCHIAYGPCQHMAILTADLAVSRILREAVTEGAPGQRTAELALTGRKSAHLEANFESTFRSWLAPAEIGERAEISASVFEDAAPLSIATTPVGRNYGARYQEGPTITVVVRRPGERKLLTDQQIATRALFTKKDWRVLGNVPARSGVARKSAQVSGIEASLTLEAMREHGGIFGAGFKAMLEFRSAVVRPLVEHHASESGAEGLRAVWVAEDSDARLPFEEVAFFPGPFPFIWLKNGRIHRVARDVDLELAKQFARTPMVVVPRGKMEEAGSRLLRATRGRGIAVPKTETFGLPPVESPRYVLRLGGHPLEVAGVLIAEYPRGDVQLYSRRSLDAAEPPRDLDGETRALEHLERAGLFSTERDDLDLATSDRPSILMLEDQAIAFWQKGLLDLRASEDPPLEIELSEQLAKVRVGGAVQVRVSISLEGDWLDTKLEFAARELPVELDVIRTALDRKQRWVQLSDGTLSRISETIESLVGEAQHVMGDQSRARLPPHQLGRLERWLDENDGRMDAAVDDLRKRLRALAVAGEPSMPHALQATLRPYQLRGLAWLQFLRSLGAGGILADDMGLGKTITALSFLLEWKEQKGPEPSLVVCPTSVATNWLHEAARFTPTLRVLLLHGDHARNLESVADYDVIITTYGILRLHQERLASFRFRCVVLDEAQFVKNSQSATRFAAGRLDAQMRLALSGTPVENRLSELWSLASFANPGMLGTENSFSKRYEKPIVNDRESPMADELRAVIRPFLLRRTKSEVLPDLPPKTEIDRFVALTAENKRLYDALALTLRSSLAKKAEERDGGAQGRQIEVFAALMRLRQMACEPRLLDNRFPPHFSSKREAFLDLVRELVAEKRRALVFSQFVELLKLWRRDLEAENIRYEYLDGSTTHRDEVVRRFQEGDAPLFLISLKAGGSGLNLTAADTVIHCDPWWNPAVEDQATDRAHRIGQDKKVTVVRLVAGGTIEEKIRSLKAKKRELTKVVVDGGAGALSGIDEDDLRMLLGDVESSAVSDADPSDAEGGEASPEVSSLGMVGELPGRGASSPANDGRVAKTKKAKGTKERPTDVVSTGHEIFDEATFWALVHGVRLWLETTGGFEVALSTMLEIPVEYVSRLRTGQPFPCSRAVAKRIEQRLLAFRRGHLH